MEKRWKKGGKEGRRGNETRRRKAKGRRERGQGGTVNGRDIRHGAHTENAKKGVYWI